MSDQPNHHAIDIDDTGTRALARVVDWYRAMGVDEACGAAGVDWLARGPLPPMRARPSSPDRAGLNSGGTAPARQPPAAPRRSPAPSRPPGRATPAPTQSAVIQTDDAVEQHARATARQAQSLSELRSLLESFDGCGLKATAKNLCFFRGAEDARVMIIGEAPGRDEDRSGIPFVGRAGQLLEKMLAAINLSEADTHITNVVYWRPPGNRVPTPQETLICRPFLERQIRLVQPEFLVTVGGSAAKLILNTPLGIMKVRGKWDAIDVPGEDGEAPLSVPVMPTLHPAYLLRSPAHKRQAWRDLLAIRARLDGKS